MTQDDALAILKTGANVFLTGEPGSGKTKIARAFGRKPGTIHSRLRKIGIVV